MENKSTAVGPLKKVSLLLTAGTTPELSDLIAAPEPLEFIFGVGTQGLTKFECLLDGKQAGDQGVIEVDNCNPDEIFGHIFSCLHQFHIHSSRFYLKYTITNIAEATPREVVKSLAAAGGCGSSCDCGCGSH